MSLRRFMSVHRSAAAVGGAVLLAALTVSGSGVAPALQAEAAPAAEVAQPAVALPSITKPDVTMASTASLVTAGSAFHLDIGYTCTAQSSTTVNLEAHQNVGEGFVAGGYGFSRVPPTCDGRKHTTRLTVVPMGERGFSRGRALVIADVSSCTPDGRTCLGVSLERSLTIR